MGLLVSKYWNRYKWFRIVSLSTIFVYGFIVGLHIILIVVSL